jgi:biotin transport system substrate-specific component
MTSIALSAPNTLARRTGLVSSRERAAILVVGAALLTALAAQVSFLLPFTPVPVTGQTFAVLLAGTALGSRLGAASQALYVALGAAGLPFYADGEGGWQAATGATAGYLVGFVVAAAVLGMLAERRQDRAVLTAVPAMLMGTAIIYALGAWWLSIELGVSAAKAVELGVAPFLIGDALKLAAAGLLLPATWRLVGSRG